ncbi:hypothetical protein L195_g023868 [Trifolium pratense]|uniref:Uncharacterized protein n=1 Tax=Trifolium pratense TaxID=57577 RepID=A0A2K3NC38_TRIPR|nr:hypothetical protein L195_g023868 [Trifolium pratense]
MQLRNQLHKYCINQDKVSNTTPFTFLSIVTRPNLHQTCLPSESGFSLSEEQQNNLLLHVAVSISAQPLLIIAKHGFKSGNQNHYRGKWKLKSKIQGLGLEEATKLKGLIIKNRDEFPYSLSIPFIGFGLVMRSGDAFKDGV